MKLGEMLDKMLEDKTIDLNMEICVNIRNYLYFMRKIKTITLNGDSYLVFASIDAADVSGRTPEDNQVMVFMDRNDALMLQDVLDDDNNEDNDLSETYYGVLNRVIPEIRKSLGMTLGRYKKEE